MTDQESKPKVKRPSKGQRAHTRRVKQAARKDAFIDNPQTGPAKPALVKAAPTKADPAKPDSAKPAPARKKQDPA